MAQLAHTLYLQPVSLRKASYRYMYICLSLSFPCKNSATPILFPFVDFLW